MAFIANSVETCSDVAFSGGQGHSAAGGGGNRGRGGPRHAHWLCGRVWPPAAAERKPLCAPASHFIAHRRSAAMSVGTAPSRRVARAVPGATVLQVLPALANDHAGRAAVNVATALLRSGARAMVASGGGRLVGELQALGGEWLQLPGAAANPVTLIGNSRKLADVIVSERVDIVHAYSGATAWSARAAIRNTGAWLVTSYFGSPLARLGAASTYQAALARGARVLVDSGFAADLIGRRHDLPPARMVVMPRSVDTARFDPPAVSAERVAILRHGWHIRPGVRVVFVPGRAIGDRIEAQGLAGLFRRIGHCSDMPAAYGVADMVVVPAVEPTTYNYIAVEAHAMARPVVASSVGVLPEIVQAPPFASGQDRTGWLVTPDDPVELARAIAAVLALDGEARQGLGMRARRIAQFYSPERIAAGTLAVYTALLEGGR